MDKGSDRSEIARTSNIFIHDIPRQDPLEYAFRICTLEARGWSWSWISIIKAEGPR